MQHMATGWNQTQATVAEGFALCATWATLKVFLLIHFMNLLQHKVMTFHTKKNYHALAA